MPTDPKAELEKLTELIVTVVPDIIQQEYVDDDGNVLHEETDYRNITLEDVLLWLQTLPRWHRITVSPNGQISYETSDTVRAEFWELGVPLSEQSDIIIRFLLSLLSHE